jgi:hypothetical protein
LIFAIARLIERPASPRQIQIDDPLARRCLIVIVRVRNLLVLRPDRRHPCLKLFDLRFQFLPLLLRFVPLFGDRFKLFDRDYRSV